MRVNRQDAWTKEEDLLLANTVIDYIKKGYTQLESFKHVAEQLNRTPAACGFRWNATIRKRYTDEIEAAKEARKKVEIEVPELDVQDDKLSSIKSVDQAIKWLEQLKQDTKNQLLNNQDQVLTSYIDENKKLKEELANYQLLIKKIKSLIDEFVIIENELMK